MILDKIIDILKRQYLINENEFLVYHVSIHDKDPFKILVATILTQNTTERNSFKAFKSLLSLTNLDPKKINAMPLSKIARAVRPSGMYKSKSKAIKELSNRIIRDFNGDSSPIKKWPIDKIRNYLITIPGIGMKTIDVLLTNIGYPVIPVDTHIRRVANRLGIVKSNKYEIIRDKLQSLLIDKKRALEAHMLLIKHGRETCKAKKPLCEKCPLKEVCNYFKLISNIH